LQASIAKMVRFIWYHLIDVITYQSNKPVLNTYGGDSIVGMHLGPENVNIMWRKHSQAVFTVFVSHITFLWVIVMWIIKGDSWLLKIYIA
jgi:hypothetical protein